MPRKQGVISVTELFIRKFIKELASDGQPNTRAIKRISEEANAQMAEELDPKRAYHR